MNSSFNLISYQPYIAKMSLYAKNPYEAKYQLLINKHECPGIKIFNDSETFIGHSNEMDDVYKNIEE